MIVELIIYVMLLAAASFTLAMASYSLGFKRGYRAGRQATLDAVVKYLEDKK